MPTYKDACTGKWYCKFYYQDWAGNRKQKKKMGFARRKDAKKYETEFILMHSGDLNMPFELFQRIYYSDMQHRLKPSTMQTKHYIIMKHILPYFKDMAMCDILPITIRKWQNQLLNKCLSEYYIRLIQTELSSVFSYAVKYYGMKENPVSTAGSVGSTRRMQEMKIWTVDDFNRFIMTQDNPYYTLFIILFWTGMRIGEVLALTWSDIDFTNHYIHITKTYHRLNGREVITSPKTRKSIRDILMFDNLESILINYQNKIYSPKKHDRLFHMHEASVRYNLKKGCNTIGLQPIRVHDLRHSHVSLLIEMGCNPLLIAERLGHENVQTTLNIYSHLYPNKQEELIEKLQQLTNKK